VVILFPQQHKCADVACNAKQPVNIISNILGPDPKTALDEIIRVHKKLQESLREIFEQMPPSLKELAAHGWYTHGGFAIGEETELANEFRRGNIKKANRQLMAYFDDNKARIVGDVKLHFPERKKIITEALSCHKKRLYFASTALFLVIADGLCDGHLFRTKSNKAALKNHLAKKGKDAGFLAVISEESGIDVPHAKRAKFPSSLNRHGALHGLDFEFGTRLNSLKAISLVGFIVDFST
jgi:hypothetical protein